MLLFQSTSWKSEKSEKAKASFVICHVVCGEIKLDPYRQLNRAIALLRETIYQVRNTPLLKKHSIYSTIKQLKS
jgi:hypothetical protein